MVIEEWQAFTPSTFLSVSTVTVALISPASPFYFRCIQRKAATYLLLQQHIYGAEKTQTLQVRVLRLMPKTTVPNEFGLPMCATAGLDPRTLVEVCAKEEQSQCPSLITATSIEAAAVMQEGSGSCMAS